jgi:hypothetical protein
VAPAAVKDVPAAGLAAEPRVLRDSLQLQQSIDKLDAKLALLKQHRQDGSGGALGTPPSAAPYSVTPQAQSAPATAGGVLVATVARGGARKLPAAVRAGHPKASVPSPNKAKAAREQRLSALPAIQSSKQQSSSSGGSGGSSRGSATADQAVGYGRGGGAGDGALERRGSPVGRGAVSCPASASGYLGAGAGVAAWGDVFGMRNGGPWDPAGGVAGLCNAEQGQYHYRQEQQQGRCLPELPRRSPDRQPRMQAWAEEQQQQYRQWDPDSQGPPFHHQQERWPNQLPHRHHQQHQQQQADDWGMYLYKAGPANGPGDEQQHSPAGPWWLQQQQQQVMPWNGNPPRPQWHHQPQQQQQGMGYGPCEGSLTAGHGHGMYWPQLQQPQYRLEQEEQQQQHVAPSSPLVPTAHYQQTVMRNRATNSSHGAGVRPRPDSSRVPEVGYYRSGEPGEYGCGSVGNPEMSHLQHQQNVVHGSYQQQEVWAAQEAAGSTPQAQYRHHQQQQQGQRDLKHIASGSWAGSQGNPYPAECQEGTVGGQASGHAAASALAGAQVWPPRGVQVTSRKAGVPQQQVVGAGLGHHQQHSDAGNGSAACRGQGGSAGSGVIRAYNLQALLS